MNQTTLFTVGHSNHSIERFLHLLKAHGIQHLVDVRSAPYSRRVPHFDKNIIAETLSGQEIRYTFMGRNLGGRPSDPRHYHQNGRANYRQMREAQKFQASLDWLMEAARNSTAAVMCSEKDPRNCHRTLLVGHELRKRGPGVLHILDDGEILEHDKLVAGLATKFRISLGEDSALLQQQAVDLQASTVAHKR